ncbi:MAG: DUF2281 domain-containing protein [Acidobacteria bacterium]|nr:DUF2281 domain-containing protein [Acidobacteriota bacterium]
MLVEERIQQYIQKLPAPLQAEVLDFIEYLLSKLERETAKREALDWLGLSLQMAMRGMEDEDTPAYTTADLKVVFAR